MTLRETTAEKKVREAREKPGVRAKKVTIPELNLEALSKKYTAPLRARYMTFTAPVDCKPEYLVQVFQKSLDRWVSESEKEAGWQLEWGHGVDVKPGRYPYMDLATGKDDFSLQEYVVGAYFYLRHPKLTRVEMEPEVVAPLTLGAD